MNFKLKNDTFLRALLRQPTEYTPLWMMRQAGRFLPEYASHANVQAVFSVCAKTRTSRPKSRCNR